MSDDRARRVVAPEVKAGGTLAGERSFFDAMRQRGPALKGSCDGLKVGCDGNVWATGSRPACA